MFGSEKYDAIYSRIKYLIGVKSGITYVFFITTKENSKVIFYDTLSVEKNVTLYNVIILIKPVLNKDQDLCYCNIFLGRYSHQLTNK